MPCEERPHPLPHDGTSQPERALPAADAGYVRADERDTADWIVQTGRLARHIAFFDANNTSTGDWRPFFEGGETALLALLAVQDVDAYRRSIAAHFVVLKSDETATSDLKSALGAVFGGVLSLTKALDEYRARLLPTVPFRAALDAAIATALRPALKALLRYHKGAAALGLLAEGDLEGWKVLDSPVESALAVIAQGLSPSWTDSSTAWTTYYAALPEDHGIFGDATWNDARKIGQAASHNLFTGLFDRYLSAYARLAREAAAALQKVLQGEGTHAPHYALFLTFLQLYRHAQDGFNTFGQRHLDFYYKDVLRLRKKPLQPDSAHLLIELSKTVNEVLLPKGTLFRGGKDSSGAEVLYGLDKNTVVNRAAVKNLAALYRGRTTDNRAGVINSGRLFYAPAINSADGLGKELKTDTKDWHPFTLRDAVGALIMPKAEIGFAIASHHLALAEGTRTIQIKLPTASGVFPASVSVDCYLTTAKGWHHVADATLVNATTSESTPTPCKAVRIVLSGGVPPITPWDAKVHGGLFNVGTPVIKIVLRHTDSASFGYESLRSITLRGVEVDVRVGVNSAGVLLPDGGAKTLQLSGDFGVLNAAKPSLPFGIEPKKGAAIIVGSEEAFSKSGVRWQLRAAWNGKPNDVADVDFEMSKSGEGPDYAPKAKGEYLGNGSWKELAGSPMDIFGSAAATHVFPSTPQVLATDGLLPADEALGIYGTASRGGFLRFTLKENFGHDAYRTALVRFQSGVSGATDPEVAPWTPQLSSLTLHYTAATFLSLQSTDTAAFMARGLRFFHLHPAGVAEQHALLTGAPTTLLPIFLHGKDSATVEHAGELYIGIEDLEGGQGVSLLVQVLEGTTDPLVLKPEDHMSWSYLTGNLWQDFEAGAVTDGTDGFIRSGIVSLTIPHDARTDNTLLPPGLLWLRAAIASAPDAVARVLTIAAGAAKVSFRDQSNAPDFLAAALPPGTIAKLKVPMVAVKKVMQPYASFGGRMEEAGTAFYPRVAERLRHRDRAVSLWDYEHLVLEAFPAVHRAKCLPHTSLTGGVYRENAPGHVMLVTVPVLSTHSGTPVLRPYTHEAVLQDIRDFLVPRTTGQATLHVAHPQFEEVRMQAKLALRPGLEFNFYAAQLREDLMQFLSPWAYGNIGAVEFGSRIRKSVLIDFVEERPYVDFITDVKLYHIVDGTPSADLDDVVASTARSILVSVPAEQHTFSPAPAEASTPPPPPCVDTQSLAQLG